MEASSSPLEHDEKSTILVILSVLSLLVALGLVAVMGCICCKRRRNQKSELAGIEGIVKLKQLDDSTLNVSIDTTDSAGFAKTKVVHNKNKNATLPLDAFKLSNGFQEFELKRSSAAPHRSLPDIPAIVEAGVGDNNSELYATVGDKLQEKEAVEKSPSTTKKLANSTLSQADDASSPYARVKSPATHAYDKVKKSKHPYAQVIQPATAGGVAQVENIDDEDEEEEEEDEDETTIENPISHRESSNNDLLSTAESHLDASAAISGRISASQELPYMTPPIMNIPQQSQPMHHQPTQHFSGDSQDSSKGYTSISVREPLANIIAQTNQQRRRREMQDSHYATVSDDSDEMYAAIEDPNNAGVDLYTSGSETYAQIQAPMTVSVEINPTAPMTNSIASQTSTVQTTRSTNSIRPLSHHEESNTQIETLKSIHSRQASSSSCTSSTINIGSPKPEKRQANSPLPPTPKGKAKDSNNNSNKTRQEVEGMYAKVMKKSKLSSVQFENSTSPILGHHEIDDVIDGIQELHTTNEYETIDKKRNRSRNSETADVGYETIPADRNNNKEESSALPHYAQIGEKIKTTKKIEEIEEDATEDPKYETLKLTSKQVIAATTDSDYDPNYEIVINKNQRISSSSSTTSSTLVDDGYSQIGKKLQQQLIDKSLKDFSDEESIPGYSTIKKPTIDHDYSSIGENLLANNLKNNDELDTESNIYSSIPAVMHAVVSPSTDSNSSEMHLDYEPITSSSVTPTTANNNYETLSIDESSTATEEPHTTIASKENPYERLHNEKGSSPDIDVVKVVNEKAPNNAVDDFFKV